MTVIFYAIEDYLDSAALKAQNSSRKTILLTASRLCGNIADRLRVFIRAPM